VRKLVFILVLACLSTESSASPWTLPQGKVAFGGNFNYQSARNEFFESKAARLFPLNGQYDSTSLSLYARVGFTDRLEFEVSLPFSLVSYQSDPVQLLAQPEESEVDSLDYYQENIIELNRTVVGIGDLRFTTRYRWFLRPFAMASEVKLKAPTGYRAPVGTFGERPTSISDFTTDLGRYVRPENVQDDVTLGDGQLDVAFNMLFGQAYRTGTFIRGNLGYNLRLADVGDQALVMLKAGQKLNNLFMVYGFVDLAYATQEGRVIGISVAAKDPGLPAASYGGVTNLLLREVRLNPSYLDVGLGLIWRLNKRLEFNLSYHRRAWGVNTAETNSFNLSFVLLNDVPGFDS